MISLVLSALALTTPPSVDRVAPQAAARSSGGKTTRRAALQTAGLFPLLTANLASADQAGQARSVMEGNEREGSFTGALRSDIGPSVLGDGVEILVSDLSYTELSECPKGFFLPTKSGPWTCIEISATALNQGRRKKPEAADIFGLLFDAEGFACLSTALDPTTKGSPVATLEMPFPKGQKVPIKFTAAVQSRSPRPLRFAAFKGDYRNAAVSRTFKAFDPCEIDSSQCDDMLDQPDNAKSGPTGLYKNQ